MCAATSAGSLPARAAWGPSVACVEGCAGMCRSCRFPREPACAVTQPKSAKPRAAAGGWGVAGALAAAQAQGCGQATVPTAAQGGPVGQGLCRRPSGPIPTVVPTIPASPCSPRRPPMPASIPGNRSPRATAAPPALFIAPHCRVPSRWHRAGAGGGWHGQSIPQGIGWHGQAIPVRHRARLARPEWLCQWISWISSSQSGRHGHRGSCRPGRGWQPGMGGGIMAAPRVCVRLLPAGRGLARHRVGWWSQRASWGCPGRGGHPQAQVGCMPGGGFAWSWSWFASPARHGGHQRCRRRLLAAALSPPAALQLLPAVPRTDPRAMGSGRGLAVAAPAVPGLATPHPCPRCVLASAGSCRPCCVVPSMRGKPQPGTAGEVGGAATE